MKRFQALLGACALALAPLVAQAQPAEVRIMWYSDGNEGEVMRDLLDRFERQNPDIKINFDRVPYKTVVEQLPALVESGQGPDLARVTDLGGLARFYLDLRPYLKDARYFDENFASTLPWFRPKGGAADGIYGIMTQLGLTLPFVNTTLFQQAKVPLPGPKASWDDWAKAAREVAARTKVPYAVAFDRSGHRMSGLAISMGAKFLNGDMPALIDEGFRKAMAMFVQWHADGTMPRALWGSVGGTAYRGANDEFSNAQLVFYYSGTWQFPQFAKSIGNNFEWQAVPNPCGPAACTGMPAGAALVPFKASKYPQAVARIVEYFASEPVYEEYHARTLFLPAHAGLAKKGISYKTDDPNVKTSLAVALAEVATTSPIAFALQGYEHNRIMFNAMIVRINQAIAGEMSLQDAFARMRGDLAEGFKAKGITIPN